MFGKRKVVSLSMNGFANHHGFDGREDDFGEAKGVLRTFDAFRKSNPFRFLYSTRKKIRETQLFVSVHFRADEVVFPSLAKTKSTYLTRTRTSTGSAWTLILILTSIYLTITETARWLAGTTTHTFSVEPGVARTLQLNLDIVVAMQCADLHVNIQDASGDRILAGDALTKDRTVWDQWSGGKDVHRLNQAVRSRSEKDDDRRREKVMEAWLAGKDVEDVHDYLAAARRSRKRQLFVKTPKLRRGVSADACRVYGSLEGNKVQGDFHITARGHGYAEFMTHLDHSGMFVRPLEVCDALVSRCFWGVFFF